MNTIEVENLLKGAIKQFGAPDQIRPSEDSDQAIIRQAANIRDLFDQLRRFVTPEALRESCLHHAEWFISHQQFRPALHACLQPFWQSADADPQLGEKATNPSLNHLAQRFRGVVNSALCRFYMELEADKRIENSITLQKCTQQLSSIVDAMKPIFAHDEQLYHLIYNGSIFLLQCSLCLMQHGYNRQAAAYVAWACRSCDTVVSLSTTKYLDWRIRLYTALCMCYERAGENAGAMQIAQQLIARIDELNELEHLDVVPPTPQQVAILQGSMEKAKLLLLKYASMSSFDGAPLEEASHVGTGKAAKNAPKAPTNVNDGVVFFQTPAEAVEKVKAIYQSRSSSKEDLAAKTINGLLLICNTSTSRLLGGSKEPSNVSLIAAEGLAMYTSPLLDDYAKRKGLLLTASNQTDAEASDNSPKGKKPPGKAGKGEKAGASKEEETTGVPALEDVLTFELMCFCIRALCSGESHDALHRWWCILQHFATSNGLNYDELFVDVTLVIALEKAKNVKSEIDAVTASLSIASILNDALSQPGFAQSHTDTVQDAALLLQATWEKIDHCHEHADAPFVLTVLIRALVAVNYQDALQVGYSSLTAIRLLEEANRVGDAIRLSRIVEGFLQERQCAFVFSRRHANCLPIETDSETISLKNAITTDDSLWLKSLREIRTKVEQFLARLRLKSTADAHRKEIQTQHEAKVEALQHRAQNAHIFGALSLKEQRTMAAIGEIELPQFVSVEDAERKLIAHAGSDHVALAVCHIESALFQKTEAKKKQKLLQAASALQDAEKELAALKKKLKTSAEPVTSISFSPTLVWCFLAQRSGELGQAEPMERAKQFLCMEFVEQGDDSLKIWNQNPAAQDRLIGVRVDNSSTILIQALSDSFVAIANGPTAEAHFDSALYVDDKSENLDKRRFNLRERQMKGLRQANMLIFAIDLALAASDESRTLSAAFALYNNLLPLLESDIPSALTLRSILSIVHALDSLHPRRFVEAELQLLAVRVLNAGFDVAAALPELAQKSLIGTLTSTFCTIWKLVEDHPNFQQQKHLRQVEWDNNFVKRALTALKLENPSDSAPAPVEKAPKPSGKAAPKTDKAPATTSAPEPKATTIFQRTTASVSDKLPLEYLELLDKILFRTPIAFPTIEQQESLFPAAFVAVAATIARAPTALPAKLAELKTSIYYPKLAVVAAEELVRKRMFDSAATICADAIKEIALRQSAISQMEQEHIQMVLAPLPSQLSASVMSPRTRSVSTLTKKVAFVRRRVAFRKIRSVQRQFDLPSHAALHEILSVIAALRASKEEAKPSVVASQPNNAKDKIPETKKPIPKGKKAEKEEERKTPRQTKPDHPNAVEETVAEKLKMEAVMEATKAVVLYGRCSKWIHLMNALQHTINLSRAFFGVNPKSGLVDVLTQVLKQNLSGTSGTSTMATDLQSLGGSTITTPVPQSVGRTNKADRFVKIEQQMKVVCSEVLFFLEKLGDSKANPHFELEFLQPAGVVTGKDCDANGIIERTTSLHMLLSTRGSRIRMLLRKQQDQKRTLLEKIFGRERAEVESQERTRRDAIGKDEAADFKRLLGEPEDDDGHSTVPSTARATPGEKKRISKTQKTKSAPVVLDVEPAQGQLAIETRLPSNISLDELMRCFMFAAQCLQFARLKLSCIELCLEANQLTQNRYAVHLLPYVMNLQYATNQSYNETLNVFHLAHREEVRILKLINVARRGWADYKESDQFRRALARLAPTFAPAQKKGFSHADDTASVGTTATSMGGPSQYKEVVTQYQNAIAYLRQKQARQHLVAMLHELGQIHFLQRTRTEAERAWCDAVDATLGTVNALSSWRSILNEFGDGAAGKIGFWKMLYCGVCLSKLAMYIYNQDLHRATEACLLLGELVHAFDSTSITAPQRYWDLSEEHKKELMADVAVDSDSTMLPQLAHGLLFAANHLLEYNLPFQALAIANALEYIAQNVIRSVDVVIQSRLIHAKAAAMVGNFKEALCTMNAVLRGQRLPDRYLGHLSFTFDLLDKSERGATATTSVKAPPGKQDKKKDEKSRPTAVDPTGEEVEYANSKPPTDEQNIRAVEAVGQYLTSTGGLPDAISEELGPTISRQIVLGLTAVLLSIAESDVVLPWQHSEDAPQAAQPKGKEAKKPVADLQGRGESGNACTAAIAIIDRILSSFSRLRPRSAVTPGQAMKPSTPSQGASTPTIPGLAQPEDNGTLLQFSFLAARLQLARGATSRAIEQLEQALTSIERDELQSLNVPNVPSFFYAINSRFISQLQICLADTYLRQHRFEAAMRVALHGLQMTAASHDAYSARELNKRLIWGQLESGLVEDALATAAKHSVSANALDWRGADAHAGCASMETATLTDSLSLVPQFNEVTVLQQYFDDTSSSMNNARRAVDGLHRYAQNNGLNLQLSFEEHTASLARYNPAVSIVIPAINDAASALLRHGVIDEAIHLLNQSIVLSEHSFASQTYSHHATIARILLAQAKRLLRAGDSIAIGRISARNAASQPTEGDRFADDRPKLCETAVSELVVKGSHDFDFIRRALSELAACYAEIPSQAHHNVVFTILREATRIAKLQHLMMYDAASINLDASISVDELPGPIVDDLEDLARRSNSSQQAFLQMAPTLEAQGKGAQPKAVSSKPPVTVVSVANYFTDLLAQLRVCSYDQSINVQARIQRVRVFLQGVTLENGQKLLLDAVPQNLKNSPENVEPYSIVGHCLPGAWMSQHNVDGELLPAAPRLHVLIAAFPNDSEKHDQVAAAAAADPKPSAKKGAKAPDVTISSPEKTRPQQKSKPIVIGVLSLEQGGARDLHQRAEDLYRDMTSSSASPRVDEAIGSDLTPTTQKQDPKKAPAPAPKAAKPSTADSSLAPTPSSPAPENFLERKGTILMSFIDLLIQSKSNGDGVSDAEARKLHPHFPLQAEHINFISQVCCQRGFVAHSGNAELCQWICNIMKTLESM